MKNYSPVSLLFMLVFVSSCYYNNKEDLFPQDPAGCDITNVSYSEIIQPILKDRCYNCHAIGLEFGGVNLEDFNALKVWVNNGRFLKSIKHESGASPMPQGGGMIPDCEIQKIEKWIENGALND